MINTTIRQGILDEFTQAAPVVQFLLSKFDFFTEIEKIAVKYALNETQERDLAIETALIIIGNSDPEEFALDIKNELGLTDEQTKNLVNDIATRIFDSMQQVQDTEMGEIGIELKAQVGQILTEQGILESTGLTLNDLRPVDRPVSSTEAKATATFKVEAPVTYEQSDPYHEPLE